MHDLCTFMVQYYMIRNIEDISTLVVDHLAQYGSTSVLDLGTFFYSYHPATLSADKSFVSPPYHTAHFSDKSDGAGSFTSYVANRLCINSNEAQDQIKVYAQNVISKLLSSGVSQINDLGKLIKRDSGIIEFEADEYFASSYYGLPEVKVKPISYYRSNEVAPAEAEYAVSRPYVNTDASSPLVSTPAKEESSFGFFRAILGILVLLLFATLIYKKCSNTTSIDLSKPIDKDIIVEEPIQVDQEVNKGEGKLGVPQKPMPSKVTECVIIVGAFESPRNALKMSDKISKLGYTPYQEYFDTMGVTRVGFKFSCEDEDLELFIHKVRHQIDKNAWYLVPRITVD